MVNHSSPFPYTQEAGFEQAIGGPIAALWQQRQEGFLKTRDKKQLYWCKLTHPQHNKAVLVVNGRVESAWKYQELLFDLYQQGYDVYSYDHRGQGLSERLVKDSDIGHVEEFDDYVLDLEALITHFDLASYSQRHLISHSMGGAVATRYLQTHPQHGFDSLVLSAPMFGIRLPWYLRPVAMVMSQILAAFSATPSYAPGHKHYYEKPFEDNPLTQSQVRYQWFRQLYRDKPQLQVGGPSTCWVWQSLMAAKLCILLTRQLALPVLLLQAGGDRIVSSSAQKRFFQRLRKTNPHCQMVTIDGAQHELFFEKDQFRNQTLNAILNFLQKEESERA